MILEFDIGHFGPPYFFGVCLNMAPALKHNTTPSGHTPFSHLCLQSIYKSNLSHIYNQCMPPAGLKFSKEKKMSFLFLIKM